MCLVTALSLRFVSSPDQVCRVHWVFDIQSRPFSSFPSWHCFAAVLCFPFFCFCLFFLFHPFFAFVQVRDVVSLFQNFVCFHWSRLWNLKIDSVHLIFVAAQSKLKRRERRSWWESVAAVSVSLFILIRFWLFSNVAVLCVAPLFFSSAIQCKYCTLRYIPSIGVL